ncbi:helix-turn-helix domain-containing protein [Methylobacterium brachiatum]|uniref:helix-turn-helix domain-containing protein n=1 Tax=Methylobacterium brachiatum TaxID=269660 RepID=UPI0008E00482|nr:helix-turn-helix domain-containing protein [Methylobacterium brachiatum]SFJ68745.1 hypothetical protein SAMN02799642_05182 [Methylobacterium brachiatum]
MPTPAEKIIAKFDGARSLAHAIGVKPSAVYRWTYPRERGGTGGYVPTAHIPKIKDAADLLGVVLTAEDWEA